MLKYKLVYEKDQTKTHSVCTFFGSPILEVSIYRDMNVIDLSFDTKQDTEKIFEEIQAFFIDYKKIIPIRKQEEEFSIDSLIIDQNSENVYEKLSLRNSVSKEVFILYNDQCQNISINSFLSKHYENEELRNFKTLKITLNNNLVLYDLSIHDKKGMLRFVTSNKDIDKISKLVSRMIECNEKKLEKILNEIN